VPWDALIRLLEPHFSKTCRKDGCPPWGLQKSRLRGLDKNRCKLNVLAALSTRFQARPRLLATA
jgi:hypothetical protein